MDQPKPAFSPAASVWNAIEIESLAYHRAHRGTLYFQATLLLLATFYNIALARGLVPGNDLTRITLTFIEFGLSVFVLANWYVETSAKHLPILWFQRKAWLNLTVYWLFITALLNGPVYLVSRQILPDVIALTTVVSLVGVFFEVFPHRKDMELEQRILAYAHERAAKLLEKPKKKPLNQRIISLFTFLGLYALAYVTILPTLMKAEAGDPTQIVLLAPVTALTYLLLTLWYLEQGGDAAFESAVRDRSIGWHVGFWIFIWITVSLCMLPVAGVSWQLFMAIGGSALALTLLFSIVARISLWRQRT